MANYNLTQTGEEVQRILDSVQTIDSSIISGSSHPVSGGAVYSYSAPRLIIPLNNYIGSRNNTDDIVSQSIDMTDDSGILGTWRGLIGRGASPQIVIDLDEEENTLHINSVVSRESWYPGEDNFITLSFYLDNRYVSLYFYAPSDDPGGGS